MHKWRRYGSQLYQKQLLLYSLTVLQYSALTIKEDFFQTVNMTASQLLNTILRLDWAKIQPMAFDLFFAFTTTCSLGYFALKETQLLRKEVRALGCARGIYEYFLDMWCG
jgi:hypothetical protein